MKILKIAGIALIATVVLSTISFFMGASFIIAHLDKITDKNAMEHAIANAIPLPLEIIITIFSVILIIASFAGFIKLGKIADNKLMIVISWTLLFFLSVNAILNSFFNYYLIYNSSQNSTLIASQAISNIIFLLFFILSYILLGASLIKAKEKIEMSKTIGILYIISVATSIIIIGSVLLWVTQIFAAIMFFKASKKYET